MKVRGNQALWMRTSHQTAALMARAVKSATRLSRGDQCAGRRKATVRSTTAAMKRAASQKLMAFSGLLGVTRSGMPAKDRVCARSIRVTARNPVPRMTA